MEEFTPQFNQQPTTVGFIKQFWIDCKRVLKSTRKPTREELKNTVKISGIGLILIGTVGFLIHLIKEIVKRGGL